MGLGFSLWLVDSKAEAARRKGQAEAACSAYGSQEAERQEGVRDKNTISQVTLLVTCIFRPGPTS